ncbi:MAG: hypothetical protein EU532_03245 [Promethearchaeota archaeon]|nr:MAG: hypothetical protein EU532_03245 [Candidatus Lokiarchaeota archaeon]
MDFKDFREGLISLALVLFIFSLTFMMGSVLAGPNINLKTEDRDFIIILTIINIIFSIYYLLEGLRLEKIFKLSEKQIIKFGKRIGFISLFYIPPVFLMGSLLFRELDNLQNLIILLILVLELCLIGVIMKEVYDLLFLEDSQRKLELEKNRKMYLSQED